MNVLHNTTFIMNVIDLSKPALSLAEPCALVKTPLKRHQKQMLHWAREREQDGGGLLFDDPGCGKTLQTLALMADGLENQKTLVVCPPMLIEVWYSEMCQHTRIPLSQIGKYYGPSRQAVVESFDDLRVVLTSYHTMAQEFGTKEFSRRSLFKRKFHRLVLDEAHYIRNEKTKASKSCLALQADVKWVITATPIVNGFGDVYPYLKLLDLHEGMTSSRWKRAYVPNKESSIALRRVLDDCALRRYKNDVLELPEKRTEDVFVPREGQESQFYAKFWDLILAKMSNIVRLMNNTRDPRMLRELMTALLAVILRIRQCCVDPRLVIEGMKLFRKCTSLEDGVKLLSGDTSMLPEGPTPDEGLQGTNRLLLAPMVADDQPTPHEIRRLRDERIPTSSKLARVIADAQARVA